MMFSRQDQGHVGLGAAKEFGDCHLTHRAPERSDLGHLILGQKLFETSDSTNIDSMLPVCLIIDPLKIGDDVISFVAVNVVDHRQFAWVGDECLRDETMDEDVFFPSVVPQSCSYVSERVNPEDESSALNSLWPIWASANSVKATKPSHVGDFVKFAVIGDRNRSPFFRESDIHVAGRPSGDVGSMIKGPLHAATFGGPAIMASVSAIYNRSHVDAH